MLSTTEAMESESLLHRYDPLTCDVLLELRATGEYCDATLRTDDQHLFKVHRAILCCKNEQLLITTTRRSSSACSSFFRALFTNGMNETTDRIVDIHDINGDTLNMIIDYAYRREIKLNESNIYELLPAANQLQVLELIALCENYLVERLSPENVLGIRDLASFFCRWWSRSWKKYAVFCWQIAEISVNKQKSIFCTSSLLIRDTEGDSMTFLGVILRMCHSEVTNFSNYHLNSWPKFWIPMNWMWKVKKPSSMRWSDGSTSGRTNEEK